MKMVSLSHLCRCCLSLEADISLLKEDENLREQFLETTSIEVGNFTIYNSQSQFQFYVYNINQPKHH